MAVGRCKCEACGEHFCSVTAFDMHRTGEFRMRGHTRRCLTREEMIGRGMVPNASGAWGTGRPLSERLRPSA